MASLDKRIRLRSSTHVYYQICIDYKVDLESEENVTREWFNIEEDQPRTHKMLDWRLYSRNATLNDENILSWRGILSVRRVEYLYTCLVHGIS